MTLETRYHNVSLDSDHDLTTNVLEVALTSDLTGAVPAERIAAPSAAADLPAPAPGFTRYWWRVLVGPGQPLDPAAASDPLTLYGRLADAPEVLYPRWVVGDVEGDLPPALTNDCWPVIVPPGSQAEWSALSGEVRAYAEALATMTLRSLTAGAVGGCPVTIRPCRNGCGATGTWATYPVTGGGPDRGGVWPVLDSGTWLNVGCSAGCGACSPLNAIRLPAGAAVVTEVRVNGAVLDPSAYRLAGRLLFRLDGQPWPIRQDLGTLPTDPGAFAVTFAPAHAVDGRGALAAGALAVEYARGLVGGKCRLPSRARAVARTGVSVDLATAADLFTDGLTGVTEADLYVRAVNPNRLLVRPVVWSPDLAR